MIHTACATMRRKERFKADKVILTSKTNMPGQHTPLVNNLQVSPVQEVTGAWWPSQHHGGHVPDDLLLVTF